MFSLSLSVVIFISNYIDKHKIKFHNRTFVWTSIHSFSQPLIQLRVAGGWNLSQLSFGERQDAPRTCRQSNMFGALWEHINNIFLQ